jgi:hypothetical protein
VSVWFPTKRRNEAPNWCAANADSISSFEVCTSKTGIRAVQYQLWILRLNTYIQGYQRYRNSQLDWKLGDTNTCNTFLSTVAVRKAASLKSNPLKRPRPHGVQPGLSWFPIPRSIRPSDQTTIFSISFSSLLLPALHCAASCPDTPIHTSSSAAVAV